MSDLATSSTRRKKKIIEEETMDAAPYEQMAREQKEKVQKHIQKRQEAMQTAVDNDVSKRLSMSARTLIRRQSFSLGGALKPTREQEKMFEHLIVVGYPVDADPYMPYDRPEAEETTTRMRPCQTRPPKVLYQYPSSDLSNAQVADFCFPNGVTPTAVGLTDSMSELNTLMFGSLATLEDSEHSYTFVMNSGEAVLYGICVVQNELLTHTPSFFTDSKSTTLCPSPEFPKQRSRRKITAPRCYCLISRFPFFKLHFDVLYSLLAIERLKSFAREEEAVSAVVAKPTISIEPALKTSATSEPLPDKNKSPRERAINSKIGGSEIVPSKPKASSLDASSPRSSTSATSETDISDRLAEMKRRRKQLRKRLKETQRERPTEQIGGSMVVGQVTLPPPNMFAMLASSEKIKLTREREDLESRLTASGRLRSITEDYISKSKQRNLQPDASLTRASSNMRLNQSLKLIANTFSEPIVPDASIMEGPTESENEVVQLIHSYRHTKVSIQELKFELPGELRQYKFTCPEGNTDQLIGDWCIASLFRLMYLDDIMSLIHHTMLESKILVICQNLGILSSVLLALIPLLRPFIWQGPMIPILPKNLEECVHSPVPYIIGVTDLCAEHMDVVKDECLIIDLDAYTFSFPSPTYSSFPAMPNQAVLYESLKEPYAELRNRPAAAVVISPPPNLTPDTLMISPRSNSQPAAIVSSRLPTSVQPTLSAPASPVMAKQQSSWKSFFKKRKEESPKEKEKDNRAATWTSAEEMQAEIRKEKEHQARVKNSATMGRKTSLQNDASAIRKKSESTRKLQSVTKSASVETRGNPLSRSSPEIPRLDEPIQRKPALAEWQVAKRQGEHPCINKEHQIYPAKVTPSDAKAVRKIMTCFQEWLNAFVDSIIQHSDWNTDWEDARQVDEVVKRYQRTDQPFMRMFFDSQMFTIFTEKLMDLAFKKKIETNKKMIEQVEERIIMEETQKAAAFSVLQIFTEPGKRSKEDKETKTELEETISCVDIRISALEQAKSLLQEEGKKMEEDKRQFEKKKRLLEAMNKA